MMKKILITLTCLGLLCLFHIGVNAGSYSQELYESYDFAYKNKITTQNSIDKADMYGGLTRIAMAKMLSQYAINILGKSPDTSKIPNFGDVNSKLDGDYNNGVTLAYQLGIMGVGIDKFRPFDSVTRAEFGTALSRVLYGDTYNQNGNNYYSKHLNALKNAGIMTKIDTPFQGEIRGYVMLMLMRAKGNENRDNNNPYNTDFYVEKDQSIVGDKSTTTSGTLTVSATSASEKKAIKGKFSELDTLTFKTSDGLNIDKIVLERYGNSSNNDVYRVYLLKQASDGALVYVSNIAYGLQNDKATFTINKDYKTIYGTEKWIIALKLNDNATTGGTIGFKLSEIVSSAKTIDMDYYNANIYEIVSLDRKENNSVELTNQLNTTHYTYNNSKTYKLASFKVKAPSTTKITINGFNLANKGNLNINDILDEVSLKVNDVDKKISYSIKNGKFTVSLKDGIDVSAKGYATFDLYGKLIDLTEFGKYIQLSISETSDVQAVEKNGSRVSVDMDGISWPKIYFDKAEDSSDNSINDNSSNDNSSNNNSSNDNSSDNSPSDSSNGNDGGVNDNSGSGDSSDNSSANNDSSSSENSSENQDSSPNNSDNCVNFEVDDGNNYNFCIVKRKSNGSKFSVKVDNAKDLSLCTVGKGGQNYDFYNCEGDISSMGSSGISQLQLSIKYNNKTYSKKVDYDLTNGVFVD